MAEAGRERFGDLLRRHRLAARLTQEELAERAGISTRAVSDLERGVKQTPHRETLRLLTEALGLSEGERERLRESVGPRLRTPALATGHNIPARLTTFVGREREMAELSALLLDPRVRLVTLTGTPGAGKTRLALELASRLAPEFEHGVCFVGLASVTSAGLVGAAIARAIGERDKLPRPPADLPAYLRDRRTLLVLDNLEHLTDASGYLTELLRGCPGLKALVTSRVLLRVPGEHNFPLHPLSLPDHDTTPERLARSEAVTLFVERARAANPAFALNRENAPSVAEIVRRLDGLPLALELAAARMRLLSPQSMLDRLSSRLDILGTGARDVPERQQALRGALEWSYRMLPASARQLFARMSVFVGGCELDAIEEVCGADVVDDLVVLADNSLVTHEEVGGRSRIGMLETVREYALERLRQEGELAATRGAHASYFLRLAERAAPELTGSDQREWLERLEAEHDNFRAALAWAREEGETGVGLRLCASLWRLWYTHGHRREGREWLEHFLSDGRDSPEEARAEALNGAGMLAWEQGDYRVASELHEESLSLRRKLGNEAGVAQSLNNLGLVALYLGQHDRAAELARESLAIRRQLGSEWGVAASLSNLGLTLLFQGRLEEAEGPIRESLALRRRLGFLQNAAESLNNLGLLALYQGHTREARRRLEQSLEMSLESGNAGCLAASTLNLGTVELEEGRLEDARESLRRALEMFRQLGDRQGLIEGLEELACLSCAEERWEEAAWMLAAAESGRELLSAPRHPAQSAQEERWLSRLGSQDTPGVETARSEGAYLSLEEAVSRALGE